MMNWQDNILTERAQIRELLAQTETVVVLGIKTEAQKISGSGARCLIHGGGHNALCPLPQHRS